VVVAGRRRPLALAAGQWHHARTHADRSGQVQWPLQATSHKRKRRNRPPPHLAPPGMQATRRRAGAAARHWPAVPSVHPPSRTLGSSQPHWSERPRRRRSPHGVYVATTRLTDGLSGSSECIDRTDSAAAEQLKSDSTTIPRPCRYRSGSSSIERRTGRGAAAAACAIQIIKPKLILVGLTETAPSGWLDRDCVYG
jgi:hypothetical protein